MINIQNTDNECFKWYLVRYLHTADHHLARIRKVYKDFARELDFKLIKILVKIINIHEIEKRIALVLVFLVMKIDRRFFYQLLLIEEEGKKHMFLSNILAHSPIITCYTVE